VTFRPNSKGELIASSDDKGSVKLYPPDSNSLQLVRMKKMGGLGRGFARHIDKLTSVVDLPDGAQECLGLGTFFGKKGTWYFVVDPTAAYMVRSAVFKWELDDTPQVKVSTTGVQWFGDRCVPESSTWTTYYSPDEKIEIPITCKSATAEPNIILLTEAKEKVFGPYRGSMLVVDHRSTRQVKRLKSGDTYGERQAGSLVGELLTQVNEITKILNLDEAKDKKVLVCLFDMNQRPSRHMVRELAKRWEKLKEKGVAVLCVQASKVEKDKLDEWVKENKIPFKVGMIEGDEEKVRFDWGVKSLPWLILADEKNIVRAEGFGIEELDEKIKENENVER
jgi:hypothetical protein